MYLFVMYLLFICLDDCSPYVNTITDCRTSEEFMYISLKAETADLLTPLAFCQSGRILLPSASDQVNTKGFSCRKQTDCSTGVDHRLLSVSD